MAAIDLLDLANQKFDNTASGLVATKGQAAIDEVDGNLDTHIADAANPHTVTQTQVGLSNVTNTSDTNKPVSTAQQTALDLKLTITDIDDVPVNGVVTVPISSNWAFDHDVVNNHIDWTNASVGFQTSGLVAVVKSGGAASDMQHWRDSTDTQDLVLRYDGAYWHFRSELGAGGTPWFGMLASQVVHFYGNVTTDGLVDGRDINADGTVLDLIEASATADQTDSEIETAYNNQVTVVSQAEAEGGIVTTVRRWSALRVKQAIEALSVTAANLSIGTKTATTVDVNSDTGTNATVPAVTITEAGVMTAADKVRLNNMEDNATNYSHPAHPGDDFSIDTLALTGATIVSDIDINVTTDALGHVTDANGVVVTRELTLADIGYTGTADANTYVHPSHPGDDFSVDTLALTGATVVSDIDINVTTDALGHVTDANGSVVTRELTLADLGYTGSPTATDYTHPAYLGDDIDIDTLPLTGATVVSDVDINVTTDLLGHVVDANGVVVTRELTLADLGYTGTTNANTYVHPSDGVDPGVALTGANVFSDIAVNAAGHVTGSATRALTKGDISLGNVDNTSDANKPVSTAQATAIGLKIDNSEKAAANGVATLGGDSKIPSSQIPVIAMTDVFVVADETAQLALTAQEGDVAVRSDLNKTYIHNGGVAATMADWQEMLTPTDSVLSVNTYTGAVTLVASDVGLGNVTNTSDANKPVSTAQQTALDLKLTITDIDDVPVDAATAVPISSNWAFDTAALVALNTAKLTNVTTDLSFSVAPTTVTVISSDGNNAVLPEANTTNAGILGSDKWDEIVLNTAKLTNVTTDLSNGTVTATAYDINSSDGTNVTLALATGTLAGIMSAADKAALDLVEASATADQTDAEIETAYNTQVSAMSQATAEAGVSTTVERVTAERISQAIAALAPAPTTIVGIAGTKAEFNTELSDGDFFFVGDSPAISISETPPSSPSSGNLWWKSSVGQLFVYYNDGDTSQWVSAAAPDTTTALAINDGVTSLTSVWSSNKIQQTMDELVILIDCGVAASLYAVDDQALNLGGAQHGE